MAVTLFSFCACTEKDNENDPSGGDNNNANTLATQLVGTWQSEHILVNGEEQSTQMTLVMNADGTGSLSTNPDTFTWRVDGNDVVVTNPHGDTYTYTVTNITEDILVVTGNYIPGTDQQVSFEGHFRRTSGDDQGGNPGDLGIGTPELVESTAHTITVTAHITGSVDQYLGQFPNYTCGITWCNVNQPSEMEHNMLDCTAQARGNNGFFECTISGLDEGHDYDIAAWLKFTPESEPKFSETRTYSTGNGGSNDTNWINLVDVMVINESTISVTVTAYFDGDPTGVGVVYSTTTEEPSISNDNTYNAFDHLNMETGEHDETIQRIQVNQDGSRTVAALLTNLQSGTMYYIRAYAEFADGMIIYSPTGSGVQTD